MYWNGEMATRCVILPHKKKNIFFVLDSKKIELCGKSQQTGDRFMKKLLASMVFVPLMASGVFASGCNEMAAFNTKIDKALKTASFNQKTLADLKSFQSECNRQHDMGMSVSSISSCNKALDLVAVN